MSNSLGFWVTCTNVMVIHVVTVTDLMLPVYISLTLVFKSVLWFEDCLTQI